ncbi:TetR/AcrR family transcriptional regulator [Nocardia sp. NPDC051570]|uniref:TetR/AcrR family transcriptional regulator n=1 Tax=Nocardia sp. NPDC051570 TaxID=3364324 RepID=UPI0037BA5E03
MGNREDLLSGARRCLLDKGYARTTVRDIATAAGVSMAAIGYHFGSKEALLNEALAEATREWGDELERALAETPDSSRNPLQHFTRQWQAIIDSISAHPDVWSATFESVAHPETRAHLATDQQEARAGLARLLADTDPSDDSAARTTGAFYQALLTGLAVQYLIDPASAPTAEDLTEGLRRITTKRRATRTRSLPHVDYAEMRQEVDEFFGTEDRIGDDDPWERNS